MSDSTSPRLFPFCKPGIMAQWGCSEVRESVDLKSLEWHPPSSGLDVAYAEGAGLP